MESVFSELNSSVPITNADFAKAKKYVKSGGKVDAIKSKYSLTEAQEHELQSL